MWCLENDFRVITVLVLNNGVWRMGYTFEPNLNFIK